MRMKTFKKIKKSKNTSNNLKVVHLSLRFDQMRFRKVVFDLLPETNNFSDKHADSAVVNDRDEPVKDHFSISTLTHSNGQHVGQMNELVETFFEVQSQNLLSRSSQYR